MHVEHSRVHGCVRLQRLYAFVILVALASSCGTTGTQVCTSKDTTSFFTALRNENCTTVEISGPGFILLQSEVSSLLSQVTEGRVSISRSVTVRAPPGTSLLPTLDVAFLKRRIELVANATLTFERLFIPHARQPSATSASGLDIVSLKPDALLVMDNVVLSYALCAPLSIAVKYSPAVPRPLSLPGAQSVSQLANVCPPLASAATGGTGPNSSCWADGLMMSNFAIAGSVLDPLGVRANMGSVLYVNSSYMCERVVAMECVSARGLPACVNDAVVEYGLSQYDTYDLHPPAESSSPSPSRSGGGGGGSGSGRGRLLSIVLPAVLGGAILAAAAGGAAVCWRRRRQQRRQEQGAQAAASKHSGGEPHSRSPGNGNGNGNGAEPAGACPSLLSDTPGTPGGAAGLQEQRALAWPSVGDGGGADWPDKGSWPGDGGGATITIATSAASAAAGDGGGGSFRVPPARTPSLAASAQRIPSASATGGGTTIGTTIGGMMYSVGTGAAVSGGGLGPRLLDDDAMQLENPLLPRRQSSGPWSPGGAGSGGPGGGAASSGRSGPSINLNMLLGTDVVASREAVLGRGTFATVLQGQLAGRPVAVKLFHRDAVGGTAEDLRSLKQEIAILARCQHPNVVELLGAGSSAGGDEVFLVEELMSTNLSRACHEGGGLPLPRVLAVARDIAAGLAYLHPTVIHRDLKPANVLLDSAGTAKLSDFGLSRQWASTVHTANPEAGTVQYMAPECFSGSLQAAGAADGAAAKTPITHHSDIYGFGVLLWEMLSVERPWRGLSSIQVALAVGYKQQRLRLPDGDHPRFHPKLRKLILQCWEQEPRKRPGAAEVTKRLSLLLQQLESHGSLEGPTAQPAASGSFPVSGSATVSVSLPASGEHPRGVAATGVGAGAGVGALFGGAGAGGGRDSGSSYESTAAEAAGAEPATPLAAAGSSWPATLFAGPQPPQQQRVLSSTAAEAPPPRPPVPVSPLRVARQ